MRYLITGAQGFIGRYLTAHILEVEKDADVVGVGRSARNNADKRLRYERLSLLDTVVLRDLIAGLRPHRIFHLASALHTASERDLVEANVLGTLSLMKAAAASEALVVLGSSGSVYGHPASLPIRESDPCNPADLYGVTKLAAEQITRIQAAQSGVRSITARIFNVVGPGQSESHVCGRFAAQLASSPKVVEAGALDTTRDFIDVRDVAAALLLLAQRGEPGGTYNLGSGRETPIRFVLSELIRISALSTAIAARSDIPRGVGRHVADVSRLRRLGFVPGFSLSESLHDLFRYHQAEQHEAKSPSRFAHQ
jgi:nucleoside-diphosphate-sugar epimerase